MNRLSTPIKEALKQEQVKFFFRKHPIILLKTLFWSVFMGALIGIILFVLGKLFVLVDLSFIRSFYVFFTLLVMIGFINIFFLEVVEYFLDIVIVTDYRILVSRRTVFLKNDNDTIDLTKIQDLGVEAHGVLRNYLNYGTLIITLSTATPPVKIEFVPDPHHTLELCNQVKRDYIWSRHERRQGYLQEIDKSDKLSS